MYSTERLIVCIFNVISIISYVHGIVLNYTMCTYWHKVLIFLITFFLQ